MEGNHSYTKENSDESDDKLDGKDDIFDGHRKRMKEFKSPMDALQFAAQGSTTSFPGTYSLFHHS